VIYGRWGEGLRTYPEHIFKDLRGTILFGEPMAQHTSFRIGGPADVMVYPHDEETLSLIITRAYASGIPFFIIGGGTNILVSDRGIRGLVISLYGARAGGVFKCIKKIHEDRTGVYIYAGAGVNLQALVRYTARNGLSGLEFAAGIPGSLGGAIYMNAGSYGKSMGDIIGYVRIVDRRGEYKNISAREIEFGYRESHIPGVAITGALLKLQRGERDHIATKIKENISLKRHSQPLGKPSAGSIFKNPPSIPAWKLIDMAGLRGVKIGDAQISQKHTNFIINRGHATFHDVLSLIKLAGKRVEKEHGITLELEIKIMGRA